MLMTIQEPAVPPALNGTPRAGLAGGSNSPTLKSIRVSLTVADDEECSQLILSTIPVKRNWLPAPPKPVPREDATLLAAREKIARVAWENRLFCRISTDRNDFSPPGFCRHSQGYSELKYLCN